MNIAFMYYLKVGVCEIFRKLYRVLVKSNKKAFLPTSYVSDLPDKALTYKLLREQPEFCSPVSFSFKKSLSRGNSYSGRFHDCFFL
jgi:hypothetical protein